MKFWGGEGFLYNFLIVEQTVSLKNLTPYFEIYICAYTFRDHTDSTVIVICISDYLTKSLLTVRFCIGCDLFFALSVIIFLFLFWLKAHSLLLENSHIVVVLKELNI